MHNPGNAPRIRRLAGTKPRSPSGGITGAALPALRSTSHRKGTKPMAHSRTPWLTGLAAALLLASAAPAAGVDKLLPPDTTVFVTVNVKQILDSPIVKKRGLGEARDALKSVDELNGVLDDLGFDPFRDLDRITVASPGGSDQDRGLLIVRGSFDLDKFKARAAQAAKDDPDVLKIQKVAGGIIYKVSPPGQDNPIFVSLLNRTTLVASPGKDYVVDAMDRESGKGKATLQSVAFAAVAAAFKGAELGPVQDFVSKLDAVGGGLTITDELKLSVVLSARSEDDAKSIKEAANNGVNLAIAALGLSGSELKEVEMLLDLLKSVKTTTKDKTVTIKARVSSEVIDALKGKDAKDDK